MKKKMPLITDPILQETLVCAFCLRKAKDIGEGEVPVAMGPICAICGDCAAAVVKLLLKWDKGRKVEMATMPPKKERKP